MKTNIECKRCGNKLFRVVANFDERYVLALCPICNARIYVVGPGDMYENGN